MIMIRDRALRSLVVVGLVLLDAILALSLIGWLIMGVGMSTGGMNGFRMPMGLTVGVSVLAAVVFVAVIAAILWALRTPAGGGEPREPAGAARTGREDVP
jgi:hypothetical protein